MQKYIEVAKKRNKMEIFNKYAVKMAAVYLIIGICWIILSDNIVALIAPNIAVLTQISSWKGIAFVLVSALVIYMARLGHGEVRKNGNLNNAPLSLIFAIISIIIVLIGIGGTSFIAHNEKEKAVNQLKTVANLKINEFERWMNERKSDAEFLRSATFFIQPKGDWKTSTDEATKHKVSARLEDLRRSSDYRCVFLTDEQGNILLQSGKNDGEPTPILQNAIKLALQTDKTVFTDIYRLDSAPDKAIVIDFISPTKSPQGAAKTVVVMRVDTGRFLYPFIRSWPIKSETAENLLFRKEGNGILFLNDLRYQKNSALSAKMDIEKNGCVSLKSMLEKPNPDEIIEGRDYRNTSVVSIVQAIPGTPWFLISKQDESEVYAAARQIARWIGLADLLTIIIIAAAMLLLRQQKELHLARIRDKEQAEKLQALQLLDAISESSTDAIFAKDMDGKYIFVNNRACLNFNKQREDVIGRDNSELFGKEDTEKIALRDKEVIESGYPIEYEEVLIMPEGEKTFLITKGVLRAHDGSVIGIFGVGRDITDRKAAENRINELNRTLEQKVKEEVAKNREKDAVLVQQSRMASMGEMLSVVAHHWRQPLNALGLIIQDAKEAKKYNELTDDYLEKMVTESMNQINFMSKTIDDFRNFFKSEEGSKVFLLRDTIGNAVKLLSPQLEEGGIRVVTTCDKDMTKCNECAARYVCGYQSALSQVILNALLNSKDAIDESRKTSAKDGVIHINLTHPSESQSVIITISDNGGGIKDDVLPKIFDPYFSTKEQGKGTGVGLYMSRVIIERSFKGTISAQNIEDGAQITIELPLPVLS